MRGAELFYRGRVSVWRSQRAEGGSVQSYSAGQIPLTLKHDDRLRLSQVSDYVATSLDQKAKRARRHGMISFGLTMAIGLAITFVFLFSHGLEPPSKTMISANITGELPPY